MNEIMCGDALDTLKTLPSGIVQTCVTSPPYFGLRDYGTAQWAGGDEECKHRVGNQVQDNKAIGAIQAGVRPGVDASRCKLCGATRQDQQIGLEDTPEAYIARLVEVFREVRRVLRDDGTLWCNIGDSYAGNVHTGTYGKEQSWYGSKGGPTGMRIAPGLKPKDLIGIPWMLAFALRADGWYLRSDIIWHKPNCMPESVEDRPTKAHEYIFLLSKNERYFYDASAIMEPVTGGTHSKGPAPHDMPKTVEMGKGIKNNKSFAAATWWPVSERNKRSVWTVSTMPYSQAHFATFPPKLIEPCILAGTSPRACEHCGAPWERVTERVQFGKAPSNSKYTNEAYQATRMNGSKQAYRAMGLEAPPPPVTIGWQPTCSHDNTGSGKCIVLDPFMGAGTVALVALEHHRQYIGIELNPEYVALINKRIYTVQPHLWEFVTPTDEERERLWYTA